MPDSARGVGEYRRKVKLVTMTVEVSVCVEWPEGIEFSEETCRDIALSTVCQSRGRDVGPPGMTVVAECSSYCREEDVRVEEVIDL